MQTDNTSQNPAGDKFSEIWDGFKKSSKPNTIQLILEQIYQLTEEEPDLAEHGKIQSVIDVLFSWENTDGLSDLKCSKFTPSGTNYIDHLSPINKKMFEMLGKLLKNYRMIQHIKH